jgi:glycosyltransferase involved in cell wall biosynthesis
VRYVLGRPEPFAPYKLLLAHPVVLYAKDWAFRHPRAPIFELLRQLRQRPVHVLWSPSWTVDRDDLAARLSRRLVRLSRRFPNTHVHVLAPTEAEVERLLRAGLRAQLINQNAFSDERIYRPLPEVEKQLDAVYDARLSPFKRHELASEIQSLGLVTSIYEGRIEPEYEAMVRSNLSHAHFFNDPFSPDYRRLTPAEVNAALNECRVGLALSAAEGTMFACIQYLLAGLPVVSTPSIGGRAEFFDPAYVLIVEPAAGAVAAGVAKMRDCAVPPVEIRERTLGSMQAHRERLFDLVDAVAAEHGVRVSFAERWPDVFTNYLLDGLEPRNAEIVAAVSDAG